MKPERFVFPAPGFSYYWKEGSGKKMLIKLSDVPNQVEIEQLCPLLFDTDTLADRVIHELFHKQGFKQANALLEKALNEGIASLDNPPECLLELFREIDQVPEWVNFDLLNEGARFCARSGIMGLIVLRNYCLMGGYESAAINKPLIFTGALQKGPAKRIAETTDFWVDATGVDALNRFEIGFKSTVKVRLMHAFARTSVQKMPHWDDRLWGKAINDWDMVATNLGFSIVFVDGLKKLGFKPTEQELKGVFHQWKYIGFLLGIPAEHLPDTEQDAIAALYKWTMSQAPADEDTKTLALALKNEPLYAVFPKHTWQKKLLVKIYLGYNHFFLGKRTCETIGLPSTWWKYYPHVVFAFKRIHEQIAISSASRYKRSVMRGRKNQEEVKELIQKNYIRPN